MNFLSIEVAAQMFLFNPSDPYATSYKQVRSAMKSGTEMVQAKTPFFHNHLHDLESLWWVAVWVVFNNNFSEPDFSTLLDVEYRLNIARRLFPPTLDSITRQYTFQRPSQFRELCDKLPHGKEDIYDALDALRRILVTDYKLIEAGYPPSINLDASNKGIYDAFTEAFSDIQALSDGLVLHFVPAIYTKLLKAENLKHPRSESTNDIRVSQKFAKK